ncbi:hypothetical protein EDD53_1589 [Pacificibacter maritimus]|uniref:DUF1285 domain-containing protein n=1 Tax=Pacificibacter maritimus TaxID=762213 RepID=A0A3N4UFE8_9RHOB|nr:DUF1285 domain-containing protein [Pacificibacter maritimus]RPE67185.1 hypothetical protein EDD53_1589 [Pacificibacter maritimus]
MTVTADSIANAIKAAKGRGLPPVEAWDPPYCGDLDIRIAKDGTWFYLGTPIGRVRLARLFSTILKKEGDDYFLVTPVEKVGITVEDAPFLAIDFDEAGQGQEQVLTFHTSMGDQVAAGAAHPLRFCTRPNGEPAPYIEIRRGLEALIDRKSFYRLVDLATQDCVGGKTQMGVWSSGVFFPFGAMLESDDA